jgi:hypothetical protein
MNTERVSLTQKENNGPAPIIVRASKLTAPGIVAKGILEKVEKNKFDDSKKDYFLRDGETLYIINETKALKDQLDQPGIMGLYLEVEYQGKIATKNKKGYHQFEVYATKVK